MTNQFRTERAAVAGHHVVDTRTNHRVENRDGTPRVWLTAASAVAYACELNGQAYDESVSNPAGRAHQWGPEYR